MRLFFAVFTVGLILATALKTGEPTAKARQIALAISFYFRSEFYQRNHSDFDGAIGILSKRLNPLCYWRRWFACFISRLSLTSAFAARLW